MELTSKEAVALKRLKLKLRMFNSRSDGYEGLVEKGLAERNIETIGKKGYTITQSGINYKLRDKKKEKEAARRKLICERHKEKHDKCTGCELYSHCLSAIAGVMGVHPAVFLLR
jgi:hypothetical protein